MSEHGQQKDLDPHCRVWCRTTHPLNLNFFVLYSTSYSSHQSRCYLTTTADACGAERDLGKCRRLAEHRQPAPSSDRPLSHCAWQHGNQAWVVGWLSWPTYFPCILFVIISLVGSWQLALALLRPRWQPSQMPRTESSTNRASRDVDSESCVSGPYVINPLTGLTTILSLWDGSPLTHRATIPVPREPRGGQCRESNILPAVPSIIARGHAYTLVQITRLLTSSSSTNALYAKRRPMYNQNHVGYSS